MVCDMKKLCERLPLPLARTHTHAQHTNTHLKGAVAALEGDGLGVLARGEEDDGGEALHIHIGVLVLSAVHLGDGHAVDLGVCMCVRVLCWFVCRNFCSQYMHGVRSAAIILEKRLASFS